MVFVKRKRNCLGVSGTVRLRFAGLRSAGKTVRSSAGGRRSTPFTGAADRAAGDRHPLGVEAMGGALADDPPRRGVALLDRDRVPGLGRAVVRDERERGARPTGQL